MKNRREQAKQVRQRKVAVLAAYSRAHTVKNCTIPKIDDNNIIETECPWNKERKLQATKETANWDAIKVYMKERDAAKKAIQAKTWRKTNLDGKYKYKGKRKPWYMLDTRKTFHYEERKKSFDAMTAFFKVLSEAAEMYNKTIFHPKGRAWFMEQMVKHKTAKWEKKHPCPVKEDQNPPDIFEQEYIVPWKAERDLAIERIRDFVVSVYDKLDVVGNRVDRKNYKMIGHTVAKIRDVDQKGHNVTYPNLKESDQLYKDATKVAQIAMDKDPTIVDCDLKNHRGDQKRPLINAKRGSIKTLKDIKKSYNFKKAP